MPADTSIYSLLRPIPMANGDLTEAAARGFDSGIRMRELASQEKVRARQQKKQDAYEAAYSRNVGEDGTINRKRLLSDLTKAGFGQEADELNAKYESRDLDAQKRKFDLYEKQMHVVGQGMEALAGMPPERRAIVYPKMRQQFLSQGLIDANSAPEQYDDGYLQTALHRYRTTKEYLERQKTLAEIGHTNAQTAQAQALTSKTGVDLQRARAEIAKTNAETGKIQQEVTQGPKANDAERMAATYGKRMQQAEAVFTQLANNGYDPTDKKSGLQRMSIRGMSLVPDRLKGESFKRQEQAESNFLSAVLRKESGAAISLSEREEASKQYFPREGDTPEVLRQKAENRALAIEGMRAGAGPAWDKVNIEKAIANVRQPTGGGDSSNAYAALPAIKPGHEDDGYVYMGGDPSDQKSWKRAR